MGGTTCWTLPMLIRPAGWHQFNPTLRPLGVVLLLVSLAIVVAYKPHPGRLSAKQGWHERPSPAIANKRPFETASAAYLT